MPMAYSGEGAHLWAMNILFIIRFAHNPIWPISFWVISLQRDDYIAPWNHTDSPQQYG